MSQVTTLCYEIQWNSPEDKECLHYKGQFTKKYNQLIRVRQMRFASIEFKRLKKDFERMDLFKTTSKTIERKVLAILARTDVTLNGEVRHVNTVKGKCATGVLWI